MVQQSQCYHWQPEKSFSVINQVRYKIYSSFPEFLLAIRSLSWQHECMIKCPPIYVYVLGCIVTQDLPTITLNCKTDACKIEWRSTHTSACKQQYREKERNKIKYSEQWQKSCSEINQKFEAVHLFWKLIYTYISSHMFSVNI